MLDAFLRFCHRFERRVSASVLIATASLLLLAGIVGVMKAHSGTTVAQRATTTTTSSSTTQTKVIERLPIEGFQTASFSLATSGGASERHCGLLADTDDTRARGLMNQDNLHGYDGMVFTFSTDVTAAFYMANVKFPLSVAWFDASGNFVSATDMEVCTVAANSCPRYNATGPYRYAVETAKGGLGALHIGNGSVITIGASGSCT